VVQPQVGIQGKEQDGDWQGHNQARDLTQQAQPSPYLAQNHSDNASFSNWQIDKGQGQHTCRRNRNPDLCCE
jgi:hypothetical protein